MTIQELISEFRISLAGENRLRIDRTGGLTDKLKAEIIAKKADIIDYLKAQEAQKAAERTAKRKREEAFLDSVPHLREIEELRTAWDAYKVKFEQAWEDGSSVYPSPPFEHSLLDDLCRQNQDAVWVLKIREEVSALSNIDLQKIADETYQKLLSGVSIADARQAYKAAHDEFVQRHLWD